MANDKDPVFCAADIIKRAKLAKEFKTDSELAAFLGISRSTLSNWNARNSIDFPLLLGSLDDVDYNWLLTGKGSPAHHSKFCDNDLVQGEVEILHTPKTADPMDDRSVTLYDISAAANLKTLLADRRTGENRRRRIFMKLSKTSSNTQHFYQEELKKIKKLQ